MLMKVMKTSRMSYVGNVICMGQMGTVYKRLDGTLEGDHSGDLGVYGKIIS
jgi:hypothetical protein